MPRLKLQSLGMHEGAAPARPIATPQAAWNPECAAAPDLQLLANDLKQAMEEAKKEVQMVPVKSQVEKVVENKHLLPTCVSCQNLMAIYMR